MPADSEGGWLQLVRRGTTAVSTGAVATGVIALTPHYALLAKFPIVSQVAGWGLKEVIDYCLGKLQKGSDEYAKLREELSKPDVRELAHQLDIRTDVLEAPSPRAGKPSSSRDFPDGINYRSDYEQLSDKLADAYLVLAHVNKHNENGSQCSQRVAKLPPLNVLPEPSSLQAEIREFCQRYSSRIGPPDPSISWPTRVFSSTPQLPDLGDYQRTDAGSGACDGSARTHRRAKHFYQHEGLVRDIMVEMAKDSTHNIGIVGMGGIGKTALACEVFEAAEVVQPGHVKYLARAEALGVKFHKKVWLNVTNKPDLSELIESAFRQLFDGADVMHNLPFESSSPDQGLRDLVLRVKQENLRVLLVLDDVWLSTIYSVVDALNFATRPDVCVPGSRLIITTRQRGALSYNGTDLMNADTLRILQMPSLSRESAWQLFQNHTMMRYRDTYSVDPHPFSEDALRRIQLLIDKFDGNPLAMVDLGDFIGYVRRPRAQRDCEARFAEEKVSNRLEKYERKLTSGSCGPNDAASESCKKSVDAAALSPSLRDCFAAFAAFREDEEVSESVLLHLFATRSPLHAPRAVNEARRKLAHLVHCSIVRAHVRADGGPPTYSMHRILHRIAVWEAKQKCKYKEQHLHHFHASSSLALSDEIGKCIRYLSAHERVPLDALLCETDTPPELRALIISDVEYSLAKPAWPLRLRFVHLRGALRVEPPNLHQAVPRANLLLLNFLSLAGSTHTDAIIKAILPAPYLWHLDLSNCTELVTVPDAICACQQLTHLNLSGCVSLTAVPMSRDVSLPASLAHLSLSGCTALAQLPQLTPPSSGSTQDHLTHLDLSGCQVTDSDCETIVTCCSTLVAVHLASCEHLTTVPDLEAVCSTLQHLDLSSCIMLRELPDDIGRCTLLAQLNLSGCCSLQALPRSITTCRDMLYLDLSECACLQSWLAAVGIDCCNKLTHADLCNAFAAADASMAMEH